MTLSQLDAIRLSNFTTQEQAKIKYELQKLEAEELRRTYEETKSCTATSLKRSRELASEETASSWLTLLPVESEGISLSKSNFRDALRLLNGMTPEHTECPPNVYAAPAFPLNMRYHVTTAAFQSSGTMKSETCLQLLRLKCAMTYPSSQNCNRLTGH